MTDPNSKSVTSSRKIRWAVVGTGAIAKVFADDMALADNCELVAVCSRKRQTAEDFAQRYGLPGIFTDVAALGKARDIDAVYLASPNAAHFDQARSLLSAGKHLLVEKPLTISSAEAASLEQQAAENGVFLMEGLWTLFLPAFEELRGLLAHGAIGQIRSIDADLSFVRPFDPQTRFYSPALGGGALFDLGIYPIAITLALFGTPRSINGDYVAAPTGVDIRANVELDFGDFTANLRCGFDSNGDNRYVILGSTGSLVIDAPFLKASRILLARTEFARRMACPKSTSTVSKALARIAGKLPVPGLTRFNHPFPKGGLQFEIQAASAAILAGLHEEKRAPLSLSIKILEIVETILRQKNKGV